MLEGRPEMDRKGSGWRAILRFAAAIGLLPALPGAGPALLHAQEKVPPDTVVELRSEGTTLTFIPDRLSLPAGSRVMLRYRNKGTLPHNLVLLLDDEGLDDMAVEAYDAVDTGYVPPGHEEVILASTPLVSPGQTVELTFVVPPPGEYTFVCLFPGHANSMIGTLRSRSRAVSGGSGG